MELEEREVVEEARAVSPTTRRRRLFAGGSVGGSAGEAGVPVTRDESESTEEVGD